MKKSFLSVILLFLSVIVFSQNNGCLEMGMQVFSPEYYGTSYPFVNIMKNANSWRTENSVFVNGGQNQWNTGFIDQIALDVNGYPLQLPISINDPNAEAHQIVFTHWSAANTLPAGNYVILYAGEGDIDISGGGVSSIISDVPGRIEYSFDPTAQYADYLELTLNTSTLGNHIRNIRVLLPGTEATHQTQPWATSWRDKIMPFKTIRFMEFAQTNSSTVSQWSDRTPLDYYTYGSDESDGVPYEWMIQLCNETQSNAWINIPHLADENFIVQLANLFKTQLNPNLKIYIEYSNETWNWLFEQTYYLDSVGNQSLNWPERTVEKIGWALRTWTNAFGNNSNRVVRVLGFQGAWFDIGDRQFAQMEEEGTAQYVDAISIACYIGLDGSQLDANSTPADVFANSHEITYDAEDAYFKSFREYANLAISKNRKLLFYEGGQHFTPEPFGSIQPYNQLLEDVQVDPEMYSAYVELFDSLRTLTSGEMLLIHHVLVAPRNGQYGSWGALENQFTQNAPYDIIAPKYQAILDNIEDCQAVLAVDYLNPLQAKVKNDKILISWITTFEENSSHFIIQRSLDGRNWENIGKARSKENLTDVNRYKFYDKNPENGNLYYRLQQFDLDGTFSYSNLARVFFEKADLQVSPNPTPGIVNIVFSKPVSGTIIISGTNGKQLFQKAINAKEVTMELNALPDGMYLLTFQSEQWLMNKKLILQR